MSQSTSSIITYLLFSIVFFGSSARASSQTINGKSVSEIDADFIQIIGVERHWSSKVTIYIDYGQKRRFSKQTRFTNENGESFNLDSMIQALNFMSKCGYEFIESYALNDDGCNVYHYLLKKRVSDG